MRRKFIGKLAAGALLIGALGIVLVQTDFTGSTLSANARQNPAGLDAEASSGPRPLELAAVEVVRVTPKSMTERFRVSGDLRPVERVVLRAKAAGTVMEVDVRPGQRVRASEVLVRFDTEELTSALSHHTSNLDGARAEHLRAEQTLGRVEQLAQKNISSRDQLEKAASEVTAARAKVQGLTAQIEIARTALRNAEIKAPFDGIVSSRAIDAGSAAAANAELLTLVDTSTLEAEMLVSTRDVSRLKVGGSVEMQIDGLDGEVVTGTIERVNPVANDGSRFVPVYVRIENRDGRLWGGMFATGAIIVRESNDVLALPATSLRSDDDGAFVLKLESGTLTRQAVAVVSRWEGGDQLELSGIRSGDVIVTSPLPVFKPGVLAVVAQAG